jgi:hypothetical protein
VKVGLGLTRSHRAFPRIRQNHVKVGLGPDENLRSVKTSSRARAPGSPDSNQAPVEPRGLLG